jgi:hypothetical protein
VVLQIPPDTRQYEKLNISGKKKKKTQENTGRQPGGICNTNRYLSASAVAILLM